MPDCVVYEHAGNKIFRVASPPPLLSPSVERKIVIVTSKPSELVRVRKHWDINLSATVICQCEPPCHTSRVELFTAAVKQVAAGQFEEVLLRLSEQGDASLRLAMAQRDQPDRYTGAWFQIYRQGATDHGRVIIDWRGWCPNPPEGFSVAWAVQKRLGISSSFFGVESEGQVVTPARSRTPDKSKPKMPLGKKQG